MDRLLKLLTEINLNTDYLPYFKNSSIKEVIVYDQNKCFDFLIETTTNLPLEVYQTLLTKLKMKFNKIETVELTIIPQNIDNSFLPSYLNSFFSGLSTKYQIFKDREYNLETTPNTLIYPVYNQIEMSNLKLIATDLTTALKRYGYNYQVEFKLEKSEENKVLKEIEEEKSRVVATVSEFSKPETTKSFEPKKTELSPNKNYRPKKSNDITKIKDIIYEVDNINIEAKIFGIDIFESSKSGFKIFTLKVTDYSDSMYLKIFTKDEDEFARLKDLLKNGKWYQFYGKASDDKYAGEIVFISRYKDITPVDGHEEVRLDTADPDKKRVELHTHTKMSQMDGCIDEVKLVKQAIKWGHKAIAITDHDGCQAFPHVFNEVTKYNKELEAPYKSKIKDLTAQIKETTDPDALANLNKELEETKEAQKHLQKFKALYGVELEMSDGNLDIVVNPNDKFLEDSTYVIFDTETTGFNAGLSDSMIEIGAVKMKDGAIIENFDELINPGHSIDPEITKLTGISNSLVSGCPNEEEVTKKFKDWIGDLPLVAQNAKFDRSMLEMAYQKYNLGTLDNTILDTMVISQIINKDLKRHSLTALTKNYGITFEENDGSDNGEKHHHRADYDAEFTGYVFFKMLRQLDTMGIKTFNDLSKLPTDLEINRWCRECHVNIIAKNRSGLKYMFKLISFASTNYLVKSPRIPKKVLAQYRENLLIGSGCYNSEIFKAALTSSEAKLKDLMSFYDYIEVQPPTNYSHLIARHDINTKEEVLLALNKIIKCAKELNKLVVATSDAHTLNKDDKLYREIIINQNVPGKGRHPLARYLNTPGYETIPDQYLRTTNEMLDEFSFLDPDLATEIVITNPNSIADMCEEIEVIIDTGGIPFSPKIDKSVETVIDLVYTKAESWYGNPLPTDIEERIAKELYGDSLLASINDELKREGNLSGDELKQESFKRLHAAIIKGDDEVKRIVRNNIQINSPESLTDKELDKQLTKSLGGIIGGGFDVIYLIAQKLVKHSNDDGFLVGSRGSVGSSFVATMMGITEVNPLAAHYRCPNCKLSIFNNPDGTPLGATYSSGFDLPDKECPNCHIPFIKDGQDMPFATFLGFNADKVPDIDLNFSDLNQASAHEYTKVLFGVDNVYRAGTIGTVAEKTAFGYVKGFCEDHGITMRTAEIERLAEGCTGVKRTTGQHPGGIVVIPGYMDVYDFTPYQFPADDPTSAWRTTHFDYHAIDQDVLKLDILGHTDPTQLRMIQDITGKDVRDVPLDDKPTMGIFLSPEPLGVTKEQIMCETGTLGIPEFGTPFTIGMLVDTKPKTFSELIKISGLSHGTDVWLGNAQELIRSGTVEFKNVIGCRDDIMVYLMYHGLEPIKAFKIMEFVRKGKASKDPDTWLKHKETMEKAGIEKWFIDSCSKIKYMFPKAHAAAYVISAFRIAYYKVHHPEIYYATYFSTRFDDFDIEVMIKGYDAIKEKIIEINNKGYDASNKETSILETLKLSLEATARGIKFGHLDIMKSDAKNFTIDTDNVTLIPPFRTIDGLGETVANSIQEEAKKGPFISVENFQKRCKVSQTLIDKMRSMDLFVDLPESSQLSLF